MQVERSTIAAVNVALLDNWPACTEIHGMDNEQEPADEDVITAEKLFWFFATAYVLRANGILAEGKEAILDSLDVYGWGNWRDHVKNQLEVDEGFIKSIYALCTEYKTRNQAVAFILRGFGCLNTEERMAEFPELAQPPQ